MSEAFDLIVAGAGPAGVGAALAAAGQGLKVVLLEEGGEAGGQVYRAPSVPARASSLVARDPDRRRGDTLRASLAASQVDFRPGRRIWSVGPGYRVDAVGPGDAESYTAPRLVAATGAYERVVPFPGWTLPGVMGLAAATILLKSQAMLPCRSVVVAGCGPLLAAVAAKILKGGGDVEAIVDLSPKSAWVKALPDLVTRPRLLMQGGGWALKIWRKAVPVRYAHTVVRAEGDGRLARVVIAPLSPSGLPRLHAAQTLEADCLAVGHGLVPGADITRLLRARHAFDRLRGGFVPVIDEDGRTSLAGLYAAGDGAGIRGALPAELMGRLAGLAAARDSLGRLTETHEGERARLLAALQRARGFADAMAALMALRPGHVRAVPAETVVCRCEDVTRAEIDAAIDAGAHDLNQLKHFTRCGMGPCQGRMCGDVVAELMAAKRGLSRESVGTWTPRPPLRPVPLAAMLGTFDYADIPIPPPAPL